jgi:S-adenosylmethionine decarboxylase
MRMNVGLAILSGIAGADLDSVERVESALRAAVERGRFSLHDLRMVRFEPHGVTGAAIVGESHLTIHTWPESGKLFVDVASCSEPASVDLAIEAIVDAFPGAKVETRTHVPLAR